MLREQKPRHTGREEVLTADRRLYALMAISMSIPFRCTEDVKRADESWWQAYIRLIRPLPFSDYRVARLRHAQMYYESFYRDRDPVEDPDAPDWDDGSDGDKTDEDDPKRRITLGDAEVEKEGQDFTANLRWDLGASSLSQKEKILAQKFTPMQGQSAQVHMAPTRRRAPGVGHSDRAARVAVEARKQYAAEPKRYFSPPQWRRITLILTPPNVRKKTLQKSSS